MELKNLSEITITRRQRTQKCIKDKNIVMNETKTKPFCRINIIILIEYLFRERPSGFDGPISCCASIHLLI